MCGSGLRTCSWSLLFLAERDHHYIWENKSAGPLLTLPLLIQSVYLILKVAFICSSCAGLDKGVVISIVQSPGVAPFWMVNGTNMNLPALNAFLRSLRMTPWEPSPGPRIAMLLSCWLKWCPAANTIIQIFFWSRIIGTDTCFLREVASTILTDTVVVVVVVCPEVVVVGGSEVVVVVDGGVNTSAG